MCVLSRFLKGDIFYFRFYKTVLVFWPKSRNLSMDLHHRFDLLLERMESSLLTEPFSEILAARSCNWEKTPDRMCRLLEFCLNHHKGTKEAIQLLQLMVDNNLGVENYRTALLIAELECKVVGWPSMEVRH